MNPLIHILIPKIFIESLLCARHCAGSWDTDLNVSEENQALVSMELILYCSNSWGRAGKLSKPVSQIISSNDKHSKGS